MAIKIYATYQKDDDPVSDILKDLRSDEYGAGRWEIGIINIEDIERWFRYYYIKKVWFSVECEIWY